MKLNRWMKAGIGLGFAALWSCPTLAEMTVVQNDLGDGKSFDYGLEAKITAQSEDDRDLGTRSGGDVNGLGLDLRPWVFWQNGAWSAYGMAQAVTATDVIQTDTLAEGDQASQDDSSDKRQADRNYLALREFWVGYSGLTPYPGEMLKFGRQRLRNDDGQWRDTNIEALAWTFDTTLLRADLGVAERFSEYRTDITELSPTDKDRLHVFGDVAAQWTPGHWVGLHAQHSHDDGSLKHAGETVDSLDKTSNGDRTWVGLSADSDAYNFRNDHTLNYWANLTWMTGSGDKLDFDQDDASLVDGKSSQNVNGWATDMGIRLKLDEQWQVGAAYARASKDYEQTGLQSNRNNYTGTRSRMNRYGEAFQPELGNLQIATLFASWRMAEDYDASVAYHKYRRIDGSEQLQSSRINALVEDDGVTSTQLVDGEKDVGQEVDFVVTKYFKQGLLPASLSQSFDDPSALVRLRGGVFKPGKAYGHGTDSTMHSAYVDVIWRF